MGKLMSRRVFLQQSALAGTAVLAAGLAGCVAPPAGESAGSAGSSATTAEQPQVSLMYYTSTTPAVARMEKQEAGFKEKYPDIELTIIQEPDDPDGKLKVIWAA
jgi:ABC-type glycerol-3-phosphate transport system substrate-binding protein